MRIKHPISPDFIFTGFGVKRNRFFPFFLLFEGFSQLKHEVGQRRQGPEVLDPECSGFGRSHLFPELFPGSISFLSEFKVLCLYRNIPCPAEDPAPIRLPESG